MSAPDGEAPKTEKELLKLYLIKVQRTQFLEHMLRQIANVTYQYNCFEMSPNLLRFAQAMAEAEVFRSALPLKKTEEPRITNFKIMLDMATQMEETQDIQLMEHASKIRDFLDLSGRLRVVSGHANEFVKVLNKTGADPDYMEKAAFFLDQWKGFCLRQFDYTVLPLLNTDVIHVTSATTEELATVLADMAPQPAPTSDDQEPEPRPQHSEHEILELKQEVEQERQLVLKYLCWPAVVRTAVYAACQYLRRVSLASGVKLFPDDPTEYRKNFQGPEFVTAYNIDECLFNRKNERRLSAMFGMQQPVNKFKMPRLPSINPELMKCVRDAGLFIELPNEPFTEPKKQKKAGGDKKGKK